MSVVAAELTEVELPAKLLKSDLQSLKSYYQFGDKQLMTYIHWPQSVTFRVRWIEDKESDNGYLKIDGDFQLEKVEDPTEKAEDPTGKIEGLYYKTKQFYVKRSDTSEMEVYPSENTLYYSQPAIEKIKPYLSIRYFSLEELQQSADSLYNTNKPHFQTVLGEYPATFMATSPEFDGHFLEYTYLCEDDKSNGKDLEVRTLIGSGEGNKLRLTDSFEAIQLVFDEEKHVFTIPESSSLSSRPLENVLGVRMDSKNTPFLAEVHDSQRRLFSKRDLAFGSEIPESLEFSEEDFLGKTKYVEPRLNYGDMDYSPQDWPNGIQFQVKGLTFKKSVNIVDGNLKGDCPFVIELEDGGDFSVGGQSVRRLCTDDNKVSVEL